MENGIIANNKKEFVDNINLLLNDKNLKEEIIKKSSESIQKYELESVKKEMSKIYDEMLEIEEKPIRVLQVIRHMNIGGAETFIMNVYRNIDREKVQFDFLVNGEGVFDEEIKKLGGKIYVMKYITEIGQIKYKENLKNFFNKHNYNIIHSHIDQVSGIILEAANECNIKCRIAHSHNTKNANNFIGKIYKAYLQSKINKNATQYFACGKEAAKWLYKKNAKDAIIIPNGIDLDKFRYNEEIRNKMREKLNIKKETFVIGHVGRFSKQKNHKFLIEIFNEYLKIDSNSRLILVGDGPLRQQIEKQINEYKIQDKVILLGNITNVQEIYQAFDFLLFPSLFEGMSVVTIEAQAEGLPILCSDTIDKKTNITNSIEFMSLKEEPKKWAEKIKEMKKKRNLTNIKILEKTDYNIKVLAKKMENRYIKLYERGNNEKNNSSNSNL